MHMLSAILTVLKQTGRPMTSREITDEINNQSLCTVFDQTIIVTISQVTKEISRNPDLFSADKTVRPMIVSMIDPSFKVENLFYYQSSRVRETRLPQNLNTSSLFEYRSEEEQHIKKRASIITIIILAILFIIGSIPAFQDDDYNASQQVSNSAYDGSVQSVRSYLKKTLKDPDSYQSIEWSSVQKEGDGYFVRHKYRAKNSFGGYVIENKIFYLDSYGNVIGSTNF